MAASSSSDDANDMYHIQCINVHLEDLVSEMNSLDVCVNIRWLRNVDYLNELRKIHERDHRNANIQFLQKLLNNTGKQASWFEDFISALEKADFGILASKIQMKEIRNYEIGKRLLEEYFPKLLHDIRPMDILLSLQQKKVIGTIDADRIRHRHGIDAVWELLLTLSKKNEDWFVLFVQTLREKNNMIGFELISGVEGNSLTQLHAKLAQKARELNLDIGSEFKSDPKELNALQDQSGETETRMEYQEERQDSGNLYCANDDNSNDSSENSSPEKINSPASPPQQVGYAAVFRSPSSPAAQFAASPPRDRAQSQVTQEQADAYNRETRRKLLEAERRNENRNNDIQNSGQTNHAAAGSTSARRGNDEGLRNETQVKLPVSNGRSEAGLPQNAVRVMPQGANAFRDAVGVGPSRGSPMATEDIGLNLRGPDQEVEFDIRSTRSGSTYSGQRVRGSAGPTAVQGNTRSSASQGTSGSSGGLTEASRDLHKLDAYNRKGAQDNVASGEVEYLKDTVYIHNLPLDATINQIIAHFSMEGDIPLKKDSNGKPSAHLGVDSRTGGNDGTARLGFIDNMLADTVIAMFNGTDFMGNIVQLETSYRTRERSLRCSAGRSPSQPSRMEIEDPARSSSPSSTIAGFTESDEEDTTLTPASVEPTQYKLELRGYQLELAEKAMSGKNCVIVAPTGSGKTHVALAITQNHFRSCSYGDSPKVVFFVPTVALVEQQKNQFERYLPDYRVIALSGDQDVKLPLSELLPKYTIFVMTPQILQNALMIEDLPSLSVFTLLIFDECHHATKLHTYNSIMGHYIDEMEAARKSRGDSVRSISGNFGLPQVIGLTASVSVGKAKSLSQAVDNVLRLCANLDTQHICTVTRNREELDKFVNKPNEHETEIEGRDPVKDPFHSTVTAIMMKIEKRMKEYNNEYTKEIDEEGETFREMLEAPRDRGCDRYTQWIHRLDKPVASIYRQEIRRFFVSCLQHLDYYNRALLVNSDCRTIDALEFLDSNIIPSVTDFHKYSDETDRWLRELYKKEKEYLEGVAADPKYENPKLKHLKSIILKYFQKKPDSRGIIFCKTRDLTVALVNWMKATEGLRQLHAHNLVGSNAPSNKFGMTQFQQEDVLKYFRDGKHKLIIATSVAEEGLDVQKCNFVIRYEHVTNTIARVQTRGRARAMDASFVLVAEKGRGMAAKEEYNKIRETLMTKAIDQINATKDTEILAKIKTFQKEAQIERQMAQHGKQLNNMRNQARLVNKNYEIRCHKCDAFAAFSRDIRKVEDSHHVITDTDYKERITIRPHPDIKKKFNDFELTGKIYCKRCNWDWGIMAIYKKVSFPVIKICSFVVVDNASSERNIYKRWKEVPFFVESLTPDDLARLCRHQSGQAMSDDDDDDDFNDFYTDSRSSSSRSMFNSIVNDSIYD